MKAMIQNADGGIVEAVALPVEANTEPLPPRGPALVAQITNGDGTSVTAESLPLLPVTDSDLGEE